MSDKFYTITVKGWLTVELSKRFAATLEESNELWDRLKDYVTITARSCEHVPKEALPCLVFDDEGGKCAFAVMEDAEKL